MTSADDLRARLRRHGQEHVLRFWDVLTEPERRELVADLESLDFDLLERLRPLVAKPPGGAMPRIEPPAVVWHGGGELPAELRRSVVKRGGAAEGDSAAQRAAAREAGLALTRAGKVAFVLVAGGQATRLGIDQPKGMFSIGPVSGRSLFQIHAERIRALARRTGGQRGGQQRGAQQPLWFVMTSPQNHAATVAYFESQAYFGLDPARVLLHPQETIPAFDREGRLLLETKHRLFRNPSGHGGILTSLARSGFLARCRAEGVEHLFYWQVDNPLVRIGDPLFLGLHHLHASAGMSSKVVAKRGPEEKVGILAADKGRTVCVEYSDLPADLRDARERGGELLYRAGNIAIHALRVEFVEALTKGGLALPWHRAEKEIRAIGERGEAAAIPGIKFETFIFDALPKSEGSVTLEVLREDEFAPVKNKSGEDSPESARAAISHYYARWFRKAGIPLPAGGDAVEVSPLFAFDYEEFLARRARIPKNRKGPLYVSEEEP